MEAKVAHTVDRKRGDAVYRYLEESYRVPGEKNPRKRIVQYLGRVGGGDDEYEEDALGVRRKKKKGLAGVISKLIKGRAPGDESEEEQKRRVAEWDKERSLIHKNNELLSGRSIKLEEIKEIADSQQKGAPESAPEITKLASENEPR